MVAVTTAQVSTPRLSMIRAPMAALIMSTLALTWTQLPVTTPRLIILPVVGATDLLPVLLATPPRLALAYHLAPRTVLWPRLVAAFPALLALVL